MKHRKLLSALLIPAFIYGSSAYAESAPNTLAIPGKILPTGTDLNSTELSANALQLAKQLQLLPVLYRIQELRAKLRERDDRTSAESLSMRQELMESREEACEAIAQCQMEVDYVLAEINDEQNLYSELLTAYTSNRDKTIAITNAISFISNGALWALGEAFDIPTYRYPRLSIPSGTISIFAGIIPSVASLYTLHEVNGHHYSAPARPNMLAKIFDAPINREIDYPQSVWSFLNSVPSGDNTQRTRRQQMIDRWVSDKNIPSFTDRNSAKQINSLTATTEQHRTLTIAVLMVRQSMLQQLGSEVFKMNRLLLELFLVVRNVKHV